MTGRADGLVTAERGRQGELAGANPGYCIWRQHQSDRVASLAGEQLLEMERVYDEITGDSIHSKQFAPCRILWPAQKCVNTIDRHLNHLAQRALSTVEPQTAPTARSA